MEIFLEPETAGALITLVFLEIVLNFDNIIFTSTVTNSLPEETRSRTWRWGLAFALVLRIIMLFAISWVMEFNSPFFSIGNLSFSVRDIILSAGGIFLIYRSTIEINYEMDGDIGKEEKLNKGAKSFLGAILQIVFIDFIFSFDSILMFVGLSNVIIIMIIATIVASIIIMLFLSSISKFIRQHPSLGVLALGFLILIGFILILESVHCNIPKGYIYFAVAFSFGIEMINIKRRKGKKLAKVATR